MVDLNRVCLQTFGLRRIAAKVTAILRNTGAFLGYVVEFEAHEYTGSLHNYEQLNVYWGLFSRQTRLRGSADNSKTNSGIYVVCALFDCTPSCFFATQAPARTNVCAGRLVFLCATQLISANIRLNSQKRLHLANFG